MAAGAARGRRIGRLPDPEPTAEGWIEDLRWRLWWARRIGLPDDVVLEIEAAILRRLVRE